MQNGVFQTGNPRWSAVFSLFMGVMALIAAEFIPVSLLTPIARDLAVSEGMAGQTVTAVGVLAVLTSLLLAPLTGNTDRRRILLAFSAMLVASYMLIGMAPCSRPRQPASRYSPDRNRPDSERTTRRPHVRCPDPRAGSTHSPYRPDGRGRVSTAGCRECGYCGRTPSRPGRRCRAREDTAVSCRWSGTHGKGSIRPFPQEFQSSCS